MSDVQQKWLDWGLQIKKDVDNCKTQGGGYCNSGSEQAFIDAYNQNDVQLQQDKENCYKQYPQN
ncbi:hypothetical protein M1615_01665 [Patescibacteria group bacterium]|nr:hypothetical protein [Patescibacteria group bacterium]